MAISADGSAPADVELGGSAVLTPATAAFSPPAASLVVVEVVIGFDANTATAPTVTVADSLSNAYAAGPSAYDGAGGGSWLFQHYYASAPGSITVTATQSGQTGTGMKYLHAWVLDGAAATQTGAASGSAHAQSGTAMTASLTPTANGSWVVAGLYAGSMTAATASGVTQDAQWNNTMDGETAAAGHAVTSSLTAESVGWTAAASSFYAVTAWEVLPASGGTTHNGSASLSGSGSLTATGHRSHSGALRVVLPGKARSRSGTLAIALPAPRAAVTGVAGSQGPLSVPLPALRLSPSGKVTHQPLKVNLPGCRVALGTGKVTHQPLKIVLPKPSPSLAGKHGHAGALVIALS